MLSCSEMAAQGTAVRTGAPQTRMCQFKLVLLGESAVGKSSLVLRFVKGQFHEYQESTIGGIYLKCHLTYIQSWQLIAFAFQWDQRRLGISLLLIVHSRM